MQATATNMANSGMVKDTLSRINELAVQTANSLGLTVINTHLRQGSSKSLEICIYRQEPAIGFADCEAMSRQLEQLLSGEEAKGSTLINGPFTIDVVSPGIERRLTTALEFTLFAGKPVRISTREKIDSLGTEFTAVLTGGDGQSIMVSQAEPLQTGKKNSTRLKLSNQPNKSLTLSLSQIYGIYLWPAGKQ